MGQGGRPRAQLLDCAGGHAARGVGCVQLAQAAVAVLWQQQQQSSHWQETRGVGHMQNVLRMLCTSALMMRHRQAGSGCALCDYACAQAQIP